MFFKKISIKRDWFLLSRLFVDYGKIKIVKKFSLLKPFVANAPILHLLKTFLVLLGGMKWVHRPQIS